jgi:uncharacterized membrane protein YgcG
MILMAGNFYHKMDNRFTKFVTYQKGIDQLRWWWMLCCSLMFLGLWGQALPERDAVYSIVPKVRVQALIRDAAEPLMQRKKIEKEVIAASFAGLSSVLADSVATSFRNDAEIRKMIQGDSIVTKLFSGAEKKKWEEKIKTAIDKQIKTEGYLWKIFLARDYSDRILSFHSDVKVHETGQLHVLETITIFNGSGSYSPDIDYSIHPDPNNDIQRGIVRDFPTHYIGKDGFWQRVGFHLNKVLVNGQESPYHTETLDNGVRIMVGESDLYIPDGVYSYQFDYVTSRQLIYHNEKDELYWNVNGNGWVFFADSVSCTVRFPAGSMIMEDACYTGFQGSTERNCYASRINDSTIHFSSASRLEPWQGLTVAAAIQKGIITPESKRGGIEFLKDNWGIGILSLVLIVIFLLYFIVWLIKGRDPKKGTIIPQFEPPADLTPADVGYISEQKYGSHLFAAALVDMAVKKYLIIQHETKGSLFKRTVYNFLQPPGTQVNLGNHLNSVYGFRPSDFYGKKVERGEYNPSIKGYYDSLDEKLKDRFRIRKGKNNTWHGLFVLNDGYTGCGGVIAIGALIFGVIYVVSHFTLNILAACVALIVLLFVVQGIFTKIIGAYNEKGRKIADEIEGFKMYLETAEQKIYQHFTPPEKTLELFEKYLPYAIALKVENAWATKFDSIVQQAIEGGYKPAYYSSTGSGSMDFSRSFRMSEMSRGISAGLSSTVASASTPPSSSGGGSSGGGSSGGGGGGGGGGGW